jgi:HK97 family phage portal protein
MSTIDEAIIEDRSTIVGAVGKPKMPVRKAQVASPPPGGLSRWTVLGAPAQVGDVVSYQKRQQMSIYYEMYRQHPVIRAAIDKKSQFAVASGFHFQASDLKREVNESKQQTLTRFFRRSSGQQLLRLTFKDLDIYGESFWLIIRSIAEARTPIKAVRLNPRYLLPVVRDGVVIAWKYGTAASSEDTITYPADIICHFRLDDPENDVQGMSPLHSLQRSVAQDIYAMEYNEAFFRNSAQTGTIFIVKTSSSDEADRNREWLEANYVGPENAHRPLLLEGDVDVKQSVSKQVEMEFLEGRKFLRQEMSMVLEVDLDKLGVHEDSNRSVSKQVDEAFRAESVWPRQSILEEEINNFIIDGIFGWSDILFKFADRDPRMTQDQADTMDKHLKSGRQSINEQRAALGLPPVDGGDVMFVMTPTGIVMVGNLEKMQEQQLVDANPLQSAGGLGSAGQQKTPAESTPKTQATARQAEAVSQRE